MQAQSAQADFVAAAFRARFEPPAIPARLCSFIATMLERTQPAQAGFAARTPPRRGFTRWPYRSQHFCAAPGRLFPHLGTLEIRYRARTVLFRVKDAPKPRGHCMSILAGARIIVGVAGGIAAYKAADLVSKLTQAGALVDVVMTERAREFVAPLTFSALSQRPVWADLWEPTGAAAARHIDLGRAAQIILVAPATANVIARLAHGMADDMLTAIALASTAPLVIAPAMETHMLAHPATVANLATLRERGAHIVPSEEGRLASGEVGAGRLPDTATLLGAARLVLGLGGDLRGRRVVVTAGGTQEAIDPVRYIGNRSSGRQGFAVAEVARDRGATVTLIAGVTTLATPYGVTRIDATSAAAMHSAVLAACVGG